MAADPDLGPDAAVPQVVPDPVRGLVKLPVRPAPAARPRRDRVRGAAGLFLDQVVQAQVPRVFRGGLVPRLDDQVPLCVTGPGQVGDGRPRVVADAVKHGLQPGQQPLDNRLVEQVGPVADPGCQPASGVGQCELEFGLGCRQVGVTSGEGHPGRCDRPPARFVAEGDLIQRVVTGVAGYPERPQHVLEGQVGVVMSIEDVSPHPPQQAHEVLVASELAAQQDRLGEVADQALGFGRIPPG